MRKCILVLLACACAVPAMAYPSVAVVLNPVPLLGFGIGGSGFGGSVEVALRPDLGIKAYGSYMKLSYDRSATPEGATTSEDVSEDFSYLSFGIEPRYYPGQEGLKGLFVGAFGRYSKFGTNLGQGSDSLDMKFTSLCLGLECGYKFAHLSRGGWFFEPSIGYGFRVGGKNDFADYTAGSSSNAYLDNTASDLKSSMSDWDFLIEKGFTASVALGLSF